MKAYCSLSQYFIQILPANYYYYSYGFGSLCFSHIQFYIQYHPLLQHIHLTTGHLLISLHPPHPHPQSSLHHHFNLQDILHPLHLHHNSNHHPHPHQLLLFRLQYYTILNPLLSFFVVLSITISGA